MTNGDAALAAGMDILAGTDDRRNGWDEINKTRDYITEYTDLVTPITKGGTGATSAVAARANLGVTESAGPDAAPPGKTPVYNANGRLVSEDAANQFDLVNLRTMNASITASINAAAYLPTAGGTITGSLFLPNASAATSGYTIAYINSDGRVSRGASSERYKKYVSAIDPASLGDIFPELHRYQMRQGDGEWKYGWIAERLAEHPDQAGFVVTNAMGAPDSIDFIALLIAQNAQLHQQLDLLAQRLTALEGGS